VAIDLAIDGTVANVVFDRPPVNAMDNAWIERMDHILEEVAGRPEVTVLHFQSALKTFSAGADLKAMRELLATAGGRDEMVEMVGRLQRVLSRIESMGTVSVAEIGGAALGGGLELCLACDLRVAAETAKLGLPEVGLGLLPGAGGTQRLPRICGDAVARRLILGAEIVDGAQAAALGLVHWSLPADELAGWTKDLVARLGALPAQALAACKACLDASNNDAVDGYALELSETRRLHDTDETQARVSAFLARRK
jgi:enoyl-CoA hydratase/carnithine racemase